MASIVIVARFTFTRRGCTVVWVVGPGPEHIYSMSTQSLELITGQRAAIVATALLDEIDHAQIEEYQRAEGYEGRDDRDVIPIEVRIPCFG